MASFGEIYVRVRGGRAFLVLLCVLCFGWMACQWIPGLPHFDPQDELLVTLLSIEASLMLSVFMALDEKAKREERRRDEQYAATLRYQVHLMETVIALSKNIEAHILEAGTGDFAGANVAPASSEHGA